MPPKLRGDLAATAGFLRSSLDRPRTPTGCSVKRALRYIPVRFFPKTGNRRWAYPCMSFPTPRTALKNASCSYLLPGSAGTNSDRCSILPITKNVKRFRGGLKTAFKGLAFERELNYSTKNMPITTSAKKALRQAERRRARNLVRKEAIVSVERKIKKLVSSGKKAGAQALLPQAYKAIDKAAKRNILHKNTAARQKSRLARLVR